jgi:release factor glutamine methyltransferase
VSTPRTVGEALRHARRGLLAVSESPASDAQLLLAACLGTSRTWILSHPEARLTRRQAARFGTDVQSYATGTPLPYVLGWWEFYGRRFRITPEVLIPRPETEVLVEASLTYLRANPDRRQAADIGTGSGCIAVTLAAEIADLRVAAADRSLPALRIALENARGHRVDGRVAVLQADLAPALAGGFDLICANLPYVPTSELMSLSVGRAEPWSSLDGGGDGLTTIRRLLAQLPEILRSGGRTVLEVGAGQAASVAEVASRLLPQACLETTPDLAGHDRVVVIDRPGIDP